MKITICPKCKWKIKEDLKGDICGYCKANEKAGINPLHIPQGDSPPVDNIKGKEINKLVDYILQR